MLVNKYFASFTGAWLQNSWDWDAKFGGYCFYVGAGLGFRVCITVPLGESFLRGLDATL